MRTTDLDRLSEPLPDGVDLEVEAARALRVVLPNLRRLEDAIFTDMRETSPHGISWWNQMAPDRRILIGDQLYACAQSISENVVEARLHFLELLDWTDRENMRIGNAVNIETGGVHGDSLRPRNALEVLARPLASLHVAGVIRALSSALDCLAGTIIGVVAVPENILKADFKSVRRTLRRTVGERDPNRRNAADRLKAEFSQMLEARIQASGPDGWVDWMLDYRNMLVHRGRRLQIGQYAAYPGTNRTSRHEAPALRAVQHLPRDPARSDVEVHREGADPTALVLTEDARTTVNGLVESTVALVESVSSELLCVWSRRRLDPDTICQPDCQWGNTADSNVFGGYQPEEFPAFDADVAMMNPLLARRLRAAAVLRTNHAERSRE